MKEHLKKITRRYSRDYIEAEMILDLLGFYDEVPIYEMTSPLDSAFDQTKLKVKRSKPKSIKRARPT